METNRFSPLEVKQLEAPARDLKSDALRGSSRLESALDNLVTIKIGDRGESVKLLQQALENMGFALPEFGADGIFGAETEAAVMAYQASQGLKVDGLVGPETVGAMDTELAGRKVTSTPAGFPFDGVVDTKSGNLRLHTEPVVKPANHIGVLAKGAHVHVLAPAANNMFKVSGTLVGRTKPSTGFVQQSFIKRVAGASPAPAVKPALTLSGNSYVDTATESRKNISSTLPFRLA